MNQRLPILCVALLLLSVAAYAQVQASTDVPYQVRYASNLTYGDSAVIFTNTGASATAANPVNQALNGNMCVNVYTLNADEQLVSCCSCYVTPDALWSLSVNRDLIANTLTGSLGTGVPTSVVIKIVATLAGAAGAGTGGVAGTTQPAGQCVNSASTAGSASFPLATAGGLAAWGTTVHALGPGGITTTTGAVLPPGGTTPPAGVTLALTETRFTASTLSATELARLNTLCGFIQGNGSGAGICATCRLGGLGSASNNQ